TDGTARLTSQKYLRPLIGFNNAGPSAQSDTLWCWTGSYEDQYFIRETVEQDFYFSSLGCSKHTPEPFPSDSKKL
ncbi:MAG: hypothetical protein DMG86_09895, partial [Acidobacteria bacterium]